MVSDNSARPDIPMATRSVNDVLPAEHRVPDREDDEQFKSEDAGARAGRHLELVQLLEKRARPPAQKTRLQVLEMDVRNPPRRFFESNRREQRKRERPHQCS